MQSSLYLVHSYWKSPSYASVPECESRPYQSFLLICLKIMCSAHKIEYRGRWTLVSHRGSSKMKCGRGWDKLPLWLNLRWACRRGRKSLSILMYLIIFLTHMVNWIPMINDLWPHSGLRKQRCADRGSAEGLPLTIAHACKQRARPAGWIIHVQVTFYCEETFSNKSRRRESSQP